MSEIPGVIVACLCLSMLVSCGKVASGDIFEPCDVREAFDATDTSDAFETPETFDTAEAFDTTEAGAAADTSHAGDTTVALDTEDTEVVPAPEWPTCPQIESQVALSDKAAYFDEVAASRHLAGDGLLRNLYLKENLQDVELWYHVENVILWSGMYLASQAFRYEVTGEQEALHNARTVVDALHHLTLVTGVSGLYGRSMYNPSVKYNPVAPESTSWTNSPAPGYEGWRFRNDVSKDGYAGLMFGYAAALEHFKDQELLTDIRARVREIIDHIMLNNLQIVDTTGLVTEHGRLYQTAMDDFPGFNAMLTSSWVKIAQTELADTTLEDFYYGCLMRVRDDADCGMLAQISELEAGYMSYMESMEQFLNLFLPGCGQNYDNFDMCYQAIYPLMRREQDPALRERLLWVVRNNMFHTDNPKFQGIDEIGNSMFTFTYAAVTGDGPEDPMLHNAVNLAICTMKEFPAEKFEREIARGQQEEVCQSRLDNPVAAETIPLSEYPFDNYLWRLDFFEIPQDNIAENRRMVYSPEDYLVAYWLGRMHGLIPADL
ncbi:MAG TPA: hypothetical protein PLC24_10215 [Myxococcota bacterium]|nr:hypothetical protein [Myxococcota bacterium]HPV04923.1 hypothetical protein [Myxococcota bacterium]